MRLKHLLTALALTVLAIPASAQEDISGTWAGVIAVTPEVNLNIHFILTAESGGYSTVVTSPDPGGAKDVAATSTTFEGNELVVTVDELSGVYEGTFSDGTFEGEWSQQGSSFALQLAPYVPPVLSQAEQDALRGDWTGNLDTPIGDVPVAYHFQTTDSGTFGGTFDSPSEGAFGIPITGVELDGEDLLVKFDVGGRLVTFEGQFTGEAMSGTFNNGGPMEFPLTMARGVYVEPSAALDLPAEAQSRLEGSWVGTIVLPDGRDLPGVIRYETNDEGEFVGYFDSPLQGAMGIPITETTLEGDTLTLSVPRIQASYTGTLSADSIDGTFSQSVVQVPLVMTRGEYAPPAAPALELSAADMQMIAGRWSGSLAGELEVIFRFETNESGAPVAYLDVPTQNVDSMPVESVSITDRQMTLRIAPISVEFTATVSADQIAGQWAQGPNPTRELTLTRD